MTFQELEELAGQAKSLEELFDLWRQAHDVDPNWRKTFPKGVDPDQNPGFRTSFCPDGLSSLNGEAVNGADNADALFLLKESHLGDDRELEKPGRLQKFWFREEPGHKQRIKYAKRMEDVLKLYFKDLDPERPVGYMNLNKRGGAESTNRAKLKAYTRQFRVFILKEIELIKPKTIFFCSWLEDFEKIVSEEPDVTVKDHLLTLPGIDEAIELVRLYHLSYWGFYRHDFFRQQSLKEDRETL